MDAVHIMDTENALICGFWRGHSCINAACDESIILADMIYEENNNDTKQYDEEENEIKKENDEREGEVNEKNNN